MLRVSTLSLHSKETHKPASVVIYLAHKPCTAFAGKDIGKLVMETLTDPGGLNLSKEFVLANNRSAGYDGEFLNLKVILFFALCLMMNFWESTLAKLHCL